MAKEGEVVEAQLFSDFVTDGERLPIGNERVLLDSTDIRVMVRVETEKKIALHVTEKGEDEWYGCSFWQPEKPIAPAGQARTMTDSGRFDRTEVWAGKKIFRWGEGNNNGNFVQLDIKRNRLIWNEGGGIQEIAIK